MELNKTTFNFNTYSMRKFLQSFKGRKKYTLLSLLACLLLGLGSAKAQTEDLTLNSFFYPYANIDYTFTPESDGTLTFETNGQTIYLTDNDYGWLKEANTGNTVNMSFNSYEDLFGMPGIQSAWFSVKGGTKYAFNWSKNVGDADIQVKFTFTSSSGPSIPDPDEPSDPVEMETIELGKYYSVNENSPLTGYYYAESTATLKATIYDTDGGAYVFGAYDPILFTDKEFNKSAEPLKSGDGYQTYSVIEGFEYFVKATIDLMNGANYQIVFTLVDDEDGPGDNDDTVIYLNASKFTSPWVTYTFTSNFEGTLRIQTNATDNICEDSDILFATDMGGMLMDPLTIQKSGKLSNDPEWGSGYWYEYSVYAGQTYYFRNDAGTLKVLFSNVDSTVDPGPGTDPDPIEPDPGVKKDLPVMDDKVVITPDNFGEYTKFLVTFYGDSDEKKERYYYTPLYDGILEMHLADSNNHNANYNPNGESATVKNTLLHTKDGAYVPFYTTYDSPEFEDPNIIIGATWKLEGGVEYYFETPLEMSASAYFYFYSDDEIIITVSDFKDILWTQETDMGEFLESNSDEPARLRLEITPKFAKSVEPASEWHDGLEMPEWIWGQRKAIESYNNNSTDGYYADGDLKVIYDEDGKLSAVKFPTCGEYTIKISTDKPNVKFEGVDGAVANLTQNLKIYPSIRNQFDYDMIVNGKNKEFRGDGVNVNSMQVKSMDASQMEIAYPVSNGKLWEGTRGNLAKSELFIPGLYDAKVYYTLESGASNVRALAAETLMDSDCTIDLSKMSPSSSSTLKLHIIKNGVDSDNWSVPDDYALILTPDSSVTPTGVDGIEAENESSVVEFYNLNGIKVNPENLEKGIYIVKKGNETYKMVKN